MAEPHSSDPAGSRTAPPTSSESDDPGDGSRWVTALAVVCLVFLAYIAGSLMMFSNTFPADQLRRAYEGGFALYHQMTAYNDPVKTDFWKPARTDARGVVRHDPDRAQQGLTLYSSGHDQRAFLIDMNGRVVHEWAMPFSQLWDETSPVVRPRSDEFVYIEKAHVFPNGDLLALYAAIGDTPWGYGLAKLDRDSNLIWKYLGHAHHDFDIDADGNIFVLTHEISEVDLPGHFDELPKPRIDDFIVKLSPDGEELAKLWLTGTFAASPLGRRLYFVPWHVRQNNRDYLHANSVHMLREAVPGIPQSRPGQALVSLREVNAIALADMEQDSIVWALSGSWVRQHDAQALANGNILLFDNEGDPSGFGVSRVIEFDPATQGIVWSYAGTAEDPLDSVERSTQNRLANGNTLIVESMAGRLLEVAPDGDIVWEFINPVRGGEGDGRIPIIFWVQRLDPERDFTPEFLNQLALR